MKILFKNNNIRELHQIHDKITSYI